jgi:hypothetical protein
MVYNQVWSSLGTKDPVNTHTFTQKLGIMLPYNFTRQRIPHTEVFLKLIKRTTLLFTHTHMFTYKLGKMRTHNFTRQSISTYQSVFR